MQLIERLNRTVELSERSQIAIDELQAARKALEEDCFATFRSSSVHDQNGHLACRIYLRVCDDIFDRFELAIRNGDAARKKLVSIK